jgi:hypothetical protein
LESLDITNRKGLLELFMCRRRVDVYVMDAYTGKRSLGKFEEAPKAGTSGKGCQRRFKKTYLLSDFSE